MGRCASVAATNLLARRSDPAASLAHPGPDEQNVMGLIEGLQSLLGGGQGGPQQQQRQEYQDFVRRYDDGPPWAGVSDQEAAQRYQQVAPRLSPQEYQQSAQEAFSRLSPQERQQFG